MLTRQGVVPDPVKIDALKRLPEPKTEFVAKLLWYCKLPLKILSKHCGSYTQLEMIVEKHK